MPSDTDRLGLDPSAAECARLVRASDPDRYFATLFAPATARPALFALYAFAGELAGIRRRVSEPMPGEIRLQWWRDALDDVFAGRTRGAPVADALARAAVAHNLPRPPFDAMIDARVFDLYDDFMPTLGDLEGYCGETESALVQLAAITLAPDAAAQSADAAGHAGVAIGLARILSEVRAEPWRSAFLPRDIREEHEVRASGSTDTTAYSAAVSALAEAGLKHVAAARRGVAALDRAVLPAFLPLAPAGLDLRRLARRADRTAAPRWRRLVALYWAARRGLA